MKVREYTIYQTAEEDKILKAVLADVKKRGVLPDAVTERDFIEKTLIPSALRMVMADLRQRSQAERLVITPKEAQEMAARMPKRPGVKIG